VHVSNYLALLRRAQSELGNAFREVGSAHADEHDVRLTCAKLARQCDRHAELLEPFAERYRAGKADEPERLHSQLFNGTRSGSLALLRDLHDLYLMACECHISWTLVGQAAQGLRDRELLDVVRSCEGETSLQLLWLRSRMKDAAPQTLVVAA
jgi:hypothetical protein